METFGEALRRMRQQHNRSLRRLAREITFGYTYIGQVERGERWASNAFASRCDAALGAGGSLSRIYAHEDQWRRQWRQDMAGRGTTAAGRESVEHEVAPGAAGQRTVAHDLHDIGLHWLSSVPGTVETVIRMWRADMLRRDFLISSSFATSGFTPAIRDWLLSWQDAEAGHIGGRRIGPTDVAVLWESCHSFQEIDRRLGGAVARSSLVHFLDNVVTPLLGGTYDEATGRDLLAVAGRLTDIAAYSAYDAHEQGMAQRYYIQALRMARAAQNDSLGAHILGDMTRQAYYIGDLNEAVALARAGQQAAARAGSKCGLARCASLEARALAMQGDRTGADAAMIRAEAAMENAQPAEESPWIRYFSFDQLQAEFAHAAEALKRPDKVLSFAQPALIAERPLERRNLLVATTAARAHVAMGNIEKAAEVGARALELVRGVVSERGLEAARSVRAGLRAHQKNPAV